jgi:hypothetical protein
MKKSRPAPTEGTYLAVDTCRMAKKTEQQKPISWKIYKVASKIMWMGRCRGAGRSR